MRSFTVVAQRAGAWWAIEVPELRGVFTQARNLDQAEAMARDAIALFLDLPADTIAIELQVVAPPEVQSVVDQALRAKEESERARAAAALAMQRAVAAAAGLGITSRDTGRMLRISHQRVAQVAGRRKHVPAREA
ncbi:MAG: type II toxin-antitoxin system HicB family antitoxin [Chloroflexota bacterium]